MFNTFKKEFRRKTDSHTVFAKLVSSSVGSHGLLVSLVAEAVNTDRVAEL